MNLILTGMRGCGKTSLGKQLATALGWSFLDLDEWIETQSNQTIVQMVKSHGWPHFRALEHEAVRHAATLDRTVIATGGGTLMDPSNTNLLKKNGHVVLLTCELPQLLKNLQQSHSRPALTPGKTTLNELEDIWESRRARYHDVADTIHDTTEWPPVETLIETLKTIPNLIT